MGLKLENTQLAQLGKARRVVVSKDTTTIIDGAGEKTAIEGRINQIQQEIENTDSDFDREKLQERLAKLAGGVAVVKVGAATETEMKEKKHRVEDALQATRAALEEGIVPGGGVALLNAQDAIDPDGLDEPTRRPARRSSAARSRSRSARSPRTPGLEGSVVVDKVRDLKPGEGLNADTGEYGDLIKAGVIDPTMVTRSALQNAASIAKNILTTEAIVAEPPEKDGAGGCRRRHARHGRDDVTRLVQARRCFERPGPYAPGLFAFASRTPLERACAEHLRHRQRLDPERLGVGGPALGDHRHLHQLRLLPGREGRVADQPAQPARPERTSAQRDVDAAAASRPAARGDQPGDLVVGERLGPGELVAAPAVAVAPSAATTQRGDVVGPDRLEAAPALRRRSASPAAARGGACSRHPGVVAVVDDRRREDGRRRAPSRRRPARRAPWRGRSGCAGTRSRRAPRRRRSARRPARSAARSRRAVAEAVELLDPARAAGRGSRPRGGSRCRRRAAPGAAGAVAEVARGRRARSARSTRMRPEPARVADQAAHLVAALEQLREQRRARRVPVAPVSRIIAAEHSRHARFARDVRSARRPRAGDVGPTRDRERAARHLAYVIAEPCIGTEGQLLRRGLPGRLHPPDPRRARLRRRRAALHRSRRVHRLRRLRRGLPGRRLLRRGPAPRGVGEVHRRSTPSTSPSK